MIPFLLLFASWWNVLYLCKVHQTWKVGVRGLELIIGYLAHPLTYRIMFSELVLAVGIDLVDSAPSLLRRIGSLCTLTKCAKNVVLPVRLLSHCCRKLRIELMKSSKSTLDRTDHKLPLNGTDIDDVLKEVRCKVVR